MATAPPNSPTVTDLPVAGSSVEERKAAAMEAQTTQLTAAVAAIQRLANVEAPTAEQSKADRFENMLRACVIGRVSTTPSVEGFVNFARELCDACDREFPAPPVP